MTISSNPHETFHKVLHQRNKDLYYKWLLGCATLTNEEKDELAIAARIARNITKD